MDKDAYSLAAEVEQKHWWFCGRRAVLASVLDRLCPAPDASRRVLEVGCGNGGNLRLLSSYGQLSAVEGDDAARERAAKLGVARMEKGWLPDDLPFENERFDLIAALDVVEHIEDDARSIRTLHDRLRPRGLLILTVPAYLWMWGQHDVFSHHKRRYTRSQLLLLTEKSGFEVIYSTYFNTLLFPFGLAHIKLEPVLKRKPAAGLRVPIRPVNSMLREVFALEKFMIPRWSLPFGISILVCARRKA